MLRDQLQPGQRPQREALGRQVVDGDLAQHGGEAEADQAHVVIERQPGGGAVAGRSEEHTSELQSLMRISYAVFCLKKNNTKRMRTTTVSHRTSYHLRDNI